jgi:peptide/nickel transport system permease protein
MVKYIAQRLAESLAVLLVMSFVIYCLIGLMPGDPIDAMLSANPGFTAEDAARLRALYGLDQPLVVRYWNWLSAALRLDFGYSRAHQVPVFDILLPALGQTLKLMASAFFIASILAISLGVLAALYRGKWPETLINFLAFAGISVPSFWLALMLIVIFAVQLGWLPASGMGTIGGSEHFFDGARYMILPVMTLSFAYIGSLTRYTRASMIETLRMDYIRTARAKGLSPGAIVWRHALRNALIPVVTVMALSFGGLVSGALITETMFAQRGMGKLIFDSIIGNDFNVALVALLFATLVTLMANLAADLLYALLDPRITLK